MPVTVLRCPLELRAMSRAGSFVSEQDCLAPGEERPGPCRISSSARPTRHGPQIQNID